MNLLCHNLVAELSYIHTDSLSRIFYADMYVY